MSNFGATSSFGSAVFGGDPTSYLLYTVDAETTTMARRLMARGQTDGTGFFAIGFGVGSGGFDPLDYMAATPVNPDAQALDTPVGVGAITHWEWPNEYSVAYYCPVDPFWCSEAIGEIGIWGIITYSPIPAEIGTFFIMAIAHFPLVAMDAATTRVFRVTMQA